MPVQQVGSAGTDVEALQRRPKPEGFVPISEVQSPYETSPNGHSVDLYDSRRSPGNRGREAMA